MRATATKLLVVAAYLGWLAWDTASFGAATCRHPCTRCGGCTCKAGCAGVAPCSCSASRAIDSIPNPQNSALVRLHVPKDAVVFINEKRAESKGDARTFRSGILAVGQTTDFAIYATRRRGKQQLSTRTCRVSLRAGQTHELRFAESDFKLSPTVSGLDPADDTGRSTSDNITIKTAFTLRGRGQPRDHVQLICQNAIVGTSTVGDDGTWNIKPNGPFRHGRHMFAARTADPHFTSDLRTSEPLVVTVIEKTPAPPKAFRLSDSSDTGDSDSDRITNQATPTLTGESEADTTVDLLLGDQTVGTGVAGADRRWTITLTVPLDSGTRELRARATDVAGNVGTLSSHTARFTVRTEPVAAPSMPRLADARGSDPIHMNNIIQSVFPHVQLAGTAQPNTKVELYYDDATAPIGDACVDCTGNWSAALSRPLPPGTYRFRATSKDVAGNVSKPSAELTATIVESKELPVPGKPRLETTSDSGESNVDGITSVAMPFVTCTAEPGSTVQLLFEGGAKPIVCAVANSAGRWSVQIKEPAAEGTHRLVARTAREGRFSRPSSALTIVVDRTPPLRPSAPALEPDSDSGVSASDRVTRVTQPVFVGTAEADSTVELFTALISGAPVGHAKADKGGKWRIAVQAPLGDGVNLVTARATDAANNASDPSLPTPVTIITANAATPAKPTLDLTSAETATLRGDAEPGTTIELLDENGIILLASSKTTSARRWTISLREPLAAGKYLLVATRTDPAGNVATSDVVAFRRPTPASDSSN